MFLEIDGLPGGRESTSCGRNAAGRLCSLLDPALEDVDLLWGQLAALGGHDVGIVLIQGDELDKDTFVDTAGLDDGTVESSLNHHRVGIEA